jgi:hypothetical protein
MQWNRLQLNLPIVPINDLGFRNNDMIAATAGRSFWILDDISALQQLSASGSELALVKPRDTHIFSGGSRDKFTPGLGQNPKSGVILDYFLPQKSDSALVKLEIFAGEKLLRTYTNKTPKDFKSWPGGPSKPEVLPAAKGLNRFTWDFRRESLPAVDGVFVYGDYNGTRVGPGSYTAKLSVDGVSVSQEFKLMPRPGIQVSETAYAEQQKVLEQIEGAIRDMHKAVNQMRSVQRQLNSHSKLLAQNEAAKPLLEKGKSILETLKNWEEKLIQPKQKTFQDVINFNNQLNAELMYLKSYVDAPLPELTQGAKQRLEDLMGEWNQFAKLRDQVIDEDMKAYNALYRELEIPAIIME